MAVTLEAIKQLRSMTGAGMLDVKKTLEETGAPIAFLDGPEESADSPENPAGD